MIIIYYNYITHNLQIHIKKNVILRMVDFEHVNKHIPEKHKQLKLKNEMK